MVMESRGGPAPPLKISETLTWASLPLIVIVAALLADGVAAFAAIIATAFAAGMGGAAFGFLFGIPRSVAAGTQAPTDAAQPGASRASYSQNTNLEQISDWLTKIVVGVGLVEAKDIAVGFGELSAKAAAAWDLADGSATAGAIMLIGAVIGFLRCYVWTRTEFINELERADDQRARDRQRRIEAENKASNMMKFIGGGPAKTGDATVPVSNDAPVLAAQGRSFLRPVADAAAKATTAAVDLWNSDDNKHQFGSADIANGKRLEAVVEPLGDDGQLCGVTLRVRALPGEPAIEGAVVFHLHPTFSQPVVRVQVLDGVAETRIIAAGAFTVGALVENDGTRLELDLSELPNIPDKFKHG